MRKATADRVACLLLAVAAWSVILLALAVFGLVAWHGAAGLSLEFIFGMPRQGMRAGGIWPAVVGTTYLMVGTMLTSIPLGLAGAVYLTEYAPSNPWTAAIRVAIINLAGVPSVVYGLFGLGLFVLFLGFGASILAGSLTLGILVLPLIITTAEEALRAVPADFRAASYALGASQWQTTRRVVLPCALPGILTGSILALGRAAGETAPILFTVAAFFLPALPTSPLHQAMVLPYHLYVLSTQVPNAPVQLQHSTALVLLLLVLALNLSAVVLRIRARRAHRW